MAKLFSSCTFFVICAVVMMMISSSMSTVDASGDLDMGWIKGSGGGASIAETLGDDVEFEFDSEISRRILATTKYISYGALQRNSVPCSRRGASYYNCQPGAQANPYNRGCSAITRCRS